MAACVDAESMSAKEASKDGSGRHIRGSEALTAMGATNAVIAAGLAAIGMMIGAVALLALACLLLAASSMLRTRAMLADREAPPWQPVIDAMASEIDDMQTESAASATQFEERVQELKQETGQLKPMTKRIAAIESWLTTHAAPMVQDPGQVVKPIVEPMLDRINRQHRDLERRCTEFQDNIKDPAPELAAVQARLDTITTTQASLTEDLATQQAALAAAEVRDGRAIASVVGDLAEERSRNAAHRKQVDDTVAHLQAQHEDAAGHQASLDTLTKQVQALQATVDGITEGHSASLEALKRRLTGMQAQLVEIQDDALPEVAFTSTQAAIRETRAALEAFTTNIDGRFIDKATLETLALQIEGLSDRVDEESNTLRELRSILDRNSTDASELPARQQAETVQGELDAMRTQRDDLSTQMHELRDRYASSEAAPAAAQRPDEDAGDQRDDREDRAMSDADDHAARLQKARELVARRRRR